MKETQKAATRTPLLRTSVSHYMIRYVLAYTDRQEKMVVNNTSKPPGFIGGINKLGGQQL